MFIKTEGLPGRTLITRAEVNLGLFEYINGFYDSRPMQERLGFLSLVEFGKEALRRAGDSRSKEPDNQSTSPG
ncbi:hypothetical protein [Streptomyces sp. NBC_01451]|uniref:hypothetical protein n=1 Tax=Streptomyces sp. NBC_01451 TaxID=2903872 RepID=UPI002E2F8CAE|nr:hypothetical protein [Streptomyces sp. NBC_01451]